jgi:type I restriction enzyme S subunit
MSFQNQTTNLRNLRFDDFLRGIEIPVRELSEQRLIADKLDHIAIRLDDARARLYTIPTILKRFRMSSLRRRVRGRLTAELGENKTLRNLRGRSSTKLRQRV